MRAWDYPKDPVVVTCAPCKRRGVYSKARFLKLVGRDTQLPAALKIIASDCPRTKEGSDRALSPCRAEFSELTEL